MADWIVYWYVIPAVITAIASALFLRDSYLVDKQSKEEGAPRRELRLIHLVFGILVPFIPLANLVLAFISVMTVAGNFMEFVEEQCNTNPTWVAIKRRVRDFFNQPLVK